MNRIYLDYNASTPVAPEVVKAMSPFLTDHYGNPSTTHIGLRQKQEVPTETQKTKSPVCSDATETRLSLLVEEAKPIIMP